MITEEGEDSSEGTDRKTIGDEFYNSPGTENEKIVIASLSVTVTGLLGAAGGGEARVGGGYHQYQQQQQQQQQLQQQQEQKQQQTQSLEEATEQVEPAFKISPPSSPSSINNNNNHNNNNSNNLPIPANFPDQQSSEAQLQLPFNPENGQLAHPLVTHSQGKMLSLVSPYVQINPAGGGGGRGGGNSMKAEMTVQFF